MSPMWAKSRDPGGERVFDVGGVDAVDLARLVLDRLADIIPLGAHVQAHQRQQLVCKFERHALPAVQVRDLEPFALQLLAELARLGRDSEAGRLDAEPQTPHPAGLLQLSFDVLLDGLQHRLLVLVQRADALVVLLFVGLLRRLVHERHNNAFPLCKIKTTSLVAGGALASD